MGDQVIGTINDENLMLDFYQYEYAEYVMNMQNMQNMWNMLNMQNQWGSYSEKKHKFNRKIALVGRAYL